MTRIFIAILVIADLSIRSTDLEAHYTNEGLWPSNLIYNFGWNPGYWSLHALSGSITLQVILFALHFLAAIFLLFGYKTRIATLAVWLLTISLHNRNLFVLQAGDDLLRLILLWGIFLPWQTHYSLDARRNPIKRKQNSFANFGYLFLMASVYFFSANLKYSPEWHCEGTAVYYALSLEQLRLPFGDLLYLHPTLLKIITWLTLYSEYLIAILILIPSKKGWFRFAAFILIILLHSGIGLTLYVGLFFLISMVAAIALIPSSIINKFEERFKIVRKAFTIKNKSSIFTWTLINSICTVLIFLCLMINLSTVKWFPTELRGELAYVGNVLRLNQYWGMFSPGVLKKDGWFVYYGRDSIGRQWDLRRNEDYVDFSKPARIVSMYKNDRWRKLAENMQNNRYTFLRPLYCKHLLDTWNKEHSKKKMHSLSVFFMEKENLPNYKTTSPIKVLHCGCYAD